ncbi:MAG: cell division topological specificity factor MinE [Epsilonproteobacteria bacterium]|nr:cell division topological specificity factor MinE [Campylobacterota bacterium]
MTLFERIFGAKKDTSANVAKDRLKVMLAHERAECAVPYLDDLKRDLLAVIQKYTKTGDVNIKSEKNQNVDMLEIEIQLGD